MNRRRAGNYTALFFAALSVGPILVSACADPKGDFDEYIDRTNGIRGVIPEGGVVTEDTGEMDAAEDVPFDAKVDVTGTFFTSCLPTLAGGNAAQSLLFYTEVTDTAGKISLTVYPLNEDATTFSKSETVGMAQVLPPVPIESDGTWLETLADVEIPGNSQRISDADLSLTNVSYHGRITSGDRMCAELGGQLVKPFMSSIDGPGDICIFMRLAEGAPIPVATSGGSMWTGYLASEHHCP